MNIRQKTPVTPGMVQDPAAAIESASTGIIRDLELSLVLRQTAGGPELIRGIIADSDLLDACSELWLENYLRRGQPELPIEKLTFRARPVFVRDGDSRCEAVDLEAEDDAGRTNCRRLPAASFDEVSLRLAQQLLEAGTLKQNDTYAYGLVAQRRAAAADRQAPTAFLTTVKNPALRFLRHPIKPLLDRAQAVGNVGEGLMPVFYTQSALNKAERFARKGADQHPPVETGCVLVGPTCSCAESGEFYSVVTDAIGLVDAEGTKLSLSYTGKTWTRITAVIRAMQSQPATAAHRLLGQAHGHNWLPLNGAPPCENCSLAKVCARTTVFVSLEDRTWTRCVFSRQPWQLCHIFGLNARKEQVQGLFGLRDNRLQERGYYVIPDFQTDSQSAK